ncbi:MAG TPA: nitrilase-related carbon-nitrogen hydrolase [Microbacteriaceae bacterium]|nr:nitrilase-related carbon-nitrogen hydrolase [Microbacteriaceae bacterium]
MRTIRVAAVSMNGLLGDPDVILDEIDRWCGLAAAEGAELVVFPELVVHGHCTPNTYDLAEPVPDGPTVRRLEEIALRRGQVLCVGLSEKERDIVYNTAVLVGPNGYLGKQRKLHMSRDETFYYKGGHDIEVIDIGDCRVSIVICYDNNFPEVGRIAALRGAEVILMPHAGRMQPWDDTADSERAARQHTRYIFMGYAQRARENACFAIVTDQVGRAGYVDEFPPDHPNQPHHAGTALVFGPSGELLAAAQDEHIREEMIVATLEARSLDRARASSGYTLRTRRPELFSELVREPS